MRGAGDLDSNLTGPPEKASLMKDDLCSRLSFPVFHEIGPQRSSSTSCGNVFDATHIIPGSTFHCGKMKDVHKFGTYLRQESFEIWMNDLCLFKVILEDNQQVGQACRDHLHGHVSVESLGR